MLHSVSPVPRHTEMAAEKTEQTSCRCPKHLTESEEFVISNMAVIASDRGRVDPDPWHKRVFCALPARDASAKKSPSRAGLKDLRAAKRRAGEGSPISQQAPQRVVFCVVYPPPNS